MTLPPPLIEIAESIKLGQQPVPVTVRTLLGWFQAQRRGFYIVRDIKSALNELHLKTEPNFEWVWIDSSIEFVKAEPANDALATETPVLEETIPREELAPDISASLVGGALADPTHRIGKLDAANRGVIFVNPEDALTRAITLMLTKNLSQLPVMTTEREVKGMITCASIGSRLASGQPCASVKDCLERHYEVSADESLFKVIPDIAQTQYVLIRDPKDKKITGIVTGSDLSLQFQQLAEPFLLLGEIEHHIRRLIENKFTQPELAAIKDPADATRQIGSVADLSLGECIRLLESEANWSKLKLALDRVEFVKEAHVIRDIRNDVMHFDPDPMTEADLGTLRNFAAFLESLWDIGMVNSASNP
jgi:CBS domain-containing protein